jgi:CheY-like chemotaxis protein
MDTNKKVLLVEDEVGASGPVKARLEQTGVAVRLVTNGDEALNSLLTEIPDMMLVDLVMPMRNGYSLIEQIKTNNLWKEIPILILSNQSSPEDISRARALGVTGYLVKVNNSLDQIVEKVITTLSGQTKSDFWP